MSIDKKTIEKVANLSRIKLEGNEKDAYVQSVGGIINWIDQLNEVNTDNIEPLASVSDLTLRLREDIVTDGDIADSVLANAPEELENFFVVPKVIE